ncbi:MAG: sulfatase [Planctomycetota bacterium]
MLLAATASAGATRQNVLLICVDDLRPELACFGASYIHSPNIDRLAAGGRVFRRHYVQAPTCGASRCALLTGRYGGSSNAALFERAAAMTEDPRRVTPSLPAWFRQSGYRTVSVGKVSHHPGGWGGPRWNSRTILEMPASWDRHLLPAGAWRDPRGWMHGLAHGEIRDDAKANRMAVVQAAEGPDAIYPDGVSVEEALAQLTSLAADETRPFFLAVGLLRPHLPFGAPAKYLRIYENATLPPTPHPDRPQGRTTWTRSGEFMKYDRGGKNPNDDATFALTVRKHYAACVSYADAQVGRLLDKLHETGRHTDTVIVLWGDHGWHLGEHAVWGKHTLFEESLRSPLIVSHPSLRRPGEATNAVVESIDLFPTLCELAGVPAPDFVHGDSLAPLLEDPSAGADVAVSYWRRAATVRTERYRLIVHADGYRELYDHNTPEGETKNVADALPEEVKRLEAVLVEKLGELAVRLRTGSTG